MRHKVAELDGAMLDAAVAKAEGLHVECISDISGCQLVNWHPDHGTTYYAPHWSWEHGGPLIERDAIALQPDEPLISTEVQRAAGMAPVAWTAWQWRDPNRRMMRGATPLRAAMRLLVASKFGDEVELP
jgi:hypothetical protein